MPGPNVGYATLTVIPSLQGFAGRLSGQMGGPGSAAGGVLGTAMNRGLLGAIGGAAVVTGVARLAGGFEAAMNRVGAVTETTGAAFDRLSDRAIQLGQDTKFSAEDAADAMFNLSTAGLDVDQVYEALPGTMELAAAANLDLATAASTSAAIVNSLGLEVSDLSHANDVLTAAALQTNASVESLGESFKFIGPVANIAGVSFEETTAALGALADQGILADMAGTGLRRIIESLINPTEKQAGLIRDLGISVYDAGGQFIGFQGIVEQFEGSGADLADLFALLGDRGGPVMAALLEEGSGALATMTENLGDSEGLAARTAETMNTGLNASLERAKSSAEAFAIAVGDAGLLAALTGIAEGAASAFNWLSQLPQPVVAIGTAIALLGPTVFVITKLVSGFAALANVILVSVLPNIGTLGAKIAALGPGGLAVGAAVAGIALLAFHINKLAQEQARAEAQANSYADALAAGGAAAVREANQLLLDNLGDVQRTYQEAGLSLEDFITAARSGGAAITEVNNQTSLDNIVFWLRNVQDGTIAVDGFTRSLVDAYSQGRLTRTEVQQIAAAYEVAAEQVAAGTAVLEDRTAAGQAAANAERATRSQLELNAVTYGRMSDRAHDAADAQSDLAEEADEAGDEIEDTTEAVLTYMEALGRLNELTSGFQEAQAGVHSAIRDVQESLAENGTTLDQNTEAGLENQTAIRDLANSFIELATAAEDAGKPQEEVAGFLDYGAEAVRNFLAEMGVAPPFIEAYVRGLGLVPPVVETTGNFLGPEAEVTEARDFGHRVGANFIEGIAAGMDSTQDVADTAAQRAVRSVHQAAVAAGEIQSPSRLMAREVGEPLSEGIAQGILDALDAPESAIDQLIARITERAIEGIGDVQSAIGAVLSVSRSQGDLADAREHLADLQAEAAGLPDAIARAQVQGAAAIAQAQAEGDDAVARAQARLDAVIRTHRPQSEVVRAQQDLDEAVADRNKAVADATKEANEAVLELTKRQAEIDDDLTRAQEDLLDAQLGVVHAQQAMIEAGQAWLEQGPEAEANFRRIAEQAGLATAEIDAFVASLSTAGSAATGAGLTAGALPAPAAGLSAGDLQAIADAAIFSEQARGVFRASIGDTNVGQIATFLAGRDTQARDAALERLTDAYHDLAFGISEDVARQLASRDLTVDQYVAAAEAMLRAAGRASGGRTASGSPYWVGENGPELVFPDDGYVMDHDRAMAWNSPGYSGDPAGGTPTVNARFYLNETQFVEIVRVEIDESNRRVLTGAGRRR